jgi:excisionase family DNA binding protein
MDNVANRYLTPEQAAERLQLGVETVYKWLRSGKLRGRRISHKAWRIAEVDLMSLIQGQNISELFFEQYLSEQGLGNADHHPEFPGATKIVDYRLLHNGKQLWFEVKEFDDDRKLFAGQKPGQVRVGAYDPYKGIRNKINDAWRKFRDYDRECCSLVLFNEGANNVHITSGNCVLGAMLGDITYSIPMDFEKGIETGPATKIFAGRGKMIHPHTKEPQNTTISAVITLERFPVGQHEARIRFANQEANEPVQLSWKERILMRQPQPSDAEVALRTVVYENPHAANPLPVDIFTGPFDERWGLVENRIDLTVIGPRMEDLKKRERELDLPFGPYKRYLERRKRAGFDTRPTGLRGTFA